MYEKFGPCLVVQGLSDGNHLGRRMKQVEYYVFSELLSDRRTLSDQSVPHFMDRTHQNKGRRRRPRRVVQEDEEFN